MVVRKFNYYRFAVFLVIVIGIISGIIFGVVKLVNNYKYKQTYDYKLTLVGYKEDEIKTIKDPSLTVLNLKSLLSTEKLSFFTILLLRNLSLCYILIV